VRPRRRFHGRAQRVQPCTCSRSCIAPFSRFFFALRLLSNSATIATSVATPSASRCRAVEA